MKFQPHTNQHYVSGGDIVVILSLVMLPKSPVVPHKCFGVSWRETFGRHVLKHKISTEGKHTPYCTCGVIEASIGLGSPICLDTEMLKPGF